MVSKGLNSREVGKRNQMVCNSLDGSNCNRRRIATVCHIHSFWMGDRSLRNSYFCCLKSFYNKQQLLFYAASFSWLSSLHSFFCSLVFVLFVDRLVLWVIDLKKYVSFIPCHIVVLFSLLKNIFNDQKGIHWRKAGSSLCFQLSAQNQSQGHDSTWREP